MQYADRQKRFHYDVILNNFYADGVITPDAAKARLQTGHVAGLLPHDDGIDRAAGEGRITCMADSLPFCQALSATADWLETGKAIEETALTALLPKHQAQPTSYRACRCSAAVRNAGIGATIVDRREKCLLNENGKI